MRLSLLVPPPPQELENHRLLELVRDFPELVPALLQLGIHPGERATLSWREVVTPELERREEISSALAWRGQS